MQKKGNQTRLMADRKIKEGMNPACLRHAGRGSVAPQAGLQQWRSHIAAKKRRKRRWMSEAPRP